MKNFTLNTGRTPIVVVAPPRSSPIRVARYLDTAGETVIGDASFTPHSIVDGAAMQAVGRDTQILSVAKQRSMLDIGTCPSCSSRLRATASTVDAIEIAKTDIHCPMCSASVTPKIDYVKLCSALAAEVASDDEDDNEDDGDDGVDDASDTYDDLSDDDDDGSDGDPEANNDPNDDESLYASGDDDGDDDTDDDNDVDDPGYASDDTDDDDDGDDDSDVEEAAARLRPLVARSTSRTHRHREHADLMSAEDTAIPMDEVPMDGSDLDTTPMDDLDMNDIDMDGTGDFDAEVASISRFIRSGGDVATLRHLATAADDDGDDDGEDDEDEDTDGDDDVDNGDDADDEDEDTDGDDDDNQEVATARRRVAIATRRLKRALADDEVQRTRDLNADKIDGNRPVSVKRDSVNIRNRQDAEIVDPDDDALEPISVGSPAATASVRRANRALIEARIGLEVAMANSLDEPAAGRPRHHAGVRERHERARERIRQQRGNRPDGNAHLRSHLAQASLEDDDTLVDPLGMEGDDMNPDYQPNTPGTTQPTPPTSMRPDVDGPTAGTEFTDPELSSLQVVDWRRARVEIVATANDTKWVFANDRPIGKLSREHASTNVQASWGPVMEKAFLNACQRGLPMAEAKEFGLRTHRLRVSGSSVIRNAIHSTHAAAEARATREIARANARLDQSIGTAFLGVMKGAWQGETNPLRDELIKAVGAQNVRQPASVVDAAIARAVEPTIRGILKRARDLAGKPDAARNEIATFVAEASYQTRPSDASDLADRLAGGNQVAVAAFSASVPAAPAAPAETGTDRVARIGRHLKNIAHR